MDSVLITMPEDPREFFLAMAVVQAYIYEYLHEVHFRIREPFYQFAFRMNEDYAPYEAALKVAKEVVPQYDYTGWTAKNRSEFNCFIDFDFKAAEKISVCTGKHITESLGILIGSRPRKTPIMPPPRCTQGNGTLILNWDGWEKAKQLQKLLRNSSIDYTSVSNSMQEISAFDIDTAEAVIGPVSALTLMAAAYNKKLIEIFPNMQSYRMYNNEGAVHNYQAVIGVGSQVGVDTIMDAWSAVSTMSYDDIELHNA
jgi:hypothetical protein